MAPELARLRYTLGWNQSCSKRAVGAKRSPGLETDIFGADVLNHIRKLPVLFLLILLPVVHGAPYVFVFHGDTVTASVYDSETLELAGTPLVGQRASLAFGVTDKQAANAFEKFYVVTPLASGYKSHRINCLQIGCDLFWDSASPKPCKMGTCSNSVTLSTCKIS